MPDTQTQTGTSGTVKPWLDVASFSTIDIERYAIVITKVFDACRITIFTTKNRSRAYLLVEDDVKKAGWARIDETARGARIRIDESAREPISNYLQNNCKINGRGAALLIAAGREPKNGQDSWVEWHVQEPGKLSAGTENEDGQMDYRERRAFVHVTKDQPILTMHAPTRGVPGADIFGTEIHARDGQWKRPVAGDGVRWDGQQQITLFASMDGTIQLTGDVINVRRILVISDVNFSSGNITYEGDVDITGTVEQGFSVKATDSISVGGEVRSGKLEGQNISVHGATTGESEIISRGRVQLGRCEGATVRCNGMVSLAGDANNIRVFCGGRFDMADRRLAGGLINALGGVTVGWLGGKEGSATQVRIDPDSCMLPDLDQVRADVERCSAQYEKIKSQLGPITTDTVKLQSLPQEQRSAINKLASLMKTIQFELDVHRTQFKKQLSGYRENMR
ncbi:MAG: FapA family protein, partial [Planctomycetes bacterium]|nr:FapA family protein [Planctomycetota bacterium]